FDRERVGIPYTLLSAEEAANATDSQEVFDTRKFGKSNRGHNFPDVLEAEEKLQVLEYLKTL
ncbi:MAG: cytochrome c, partial [bacterium]|nr:cytochrome c [bacterium]